MTTIENLWPEFPVDNLVKSPKSILEEQAIFLATNTKNLLTANINTHTNFDGRLEHTFEIVAPALNGYKYSLFTINQKDIFLYPCRLEGEGQYSINTEDDLIKKLKDIFNSAETQKIINSLMSQSKENAILPKSSGFSH